jgi:hypothetical protein
MEKQDAKQILSSRELIMLPGAYDLQVTSIQPYDGKFICNFKAMNSYHYEEAKKFIKEEKYQEACNLQLSSSIRTTDYIPSKGEIVRVNVAEVTTKSGIIGLFVTKVSEIKASKTTKVNFTFDEDSVPQEVVKITESII